MTFKRFDIAFFEDKEKARWEANWAHATAGNYGSLAWIEANYAFCLFDEQSRSYLEDQGYRTFVDVGSGDGKWMIYFAKRFGYRVAGVDYSANACRLCRENLARAGVTGEVIPLDFLHQEAPGRYDVVYLGGVIEHYQDPLAVLSKAMTYLSPGGTLINWIPTSLGLSSLYVRLFDPEQRQRVIPIDKPKIEAWYRALGLGRIEVLYNGSLCLNTFPIQRIKAEAPALHASMVFPIGQAVNKIVNRSLLAFHRRLDVRIEGKLISPFLIAYGMKVASPR